MERRAGLDPELVHEELPRLLVGGEGLGLPSSPVEGEHELAAQPLAIRVPRDERLELGHELGTAAQREVEVDALFDRGEAQAVEPGDLGLRERLLGEVGKRGAMPECERLSQRARGERRLVARPELPCLPDEPLESVEVELVVLKLEEIAGSRRANPLGTERLSQPRDVDLDRLPRARGRVIVPEAVDQPVDRDDIVPVEEEEGEERALLPRPDGDALAAVLDFQRPK